MAVRTMTMLRCLLAFALACFFAPAALAQTPDQTLFGPKQYDRTAGDPNIYTDTFSVPVSVGAPFVLRIVNGYANGQNRITSGRVKVNGVQVAGPADFGQAVAQIERSVSLGPNNTLEVQLSSAPGGFVTVTVLGTRILPVPTSLAPNPLTIAAGASGNLVATLSPAPSSEGALTVSSANASVASVPASVPFAAGQAQVVIPVTGVAAGTTGITASANGGSASATVNVTPAPPTIASLAPASLGITQGGSGTLTVTISGAQGTDTQVLLSSSDSAVTSVASSVLVPAGQVSAAIAVSAVSPGSSAITASLNGSSASSQVTVTPAPPTVVSLVPAVATVTLGASATLTLTISTAQLADTVVPLAVSPEGIVSAPAQVSVPAGQTSVAVPVGTLGFGQAGITAALNGSSASAVVNVVPQPVSVVSIVPTPFTMTVGATSQFTVTINATQPTNTDIALSVDQPSVLQIPASATVAQGQTSVTFTATGLAVGDALITASANNTSRSASVHVAPQPAALVSLLPSPLPLQQGATGTLTVTINVAQESDTAIALANSAPAVANVPASVLVAAGAVTANVPVTALAEGSTLVTASVNGTSAASTVNVTPPPPVVTSVTPATLTLPKGISGVLRVTVSRAPNVASAVALSSSDAAVASVPPVVNIPAGALFADFPVASNTQGQAVVTASLNGGTANATVTVAAPEPVSLILSPQTPTNYVGEAVPFTANAPMTDGTTQDLTAQVAWTSSDTNIATIAATGVATVLDAGQSTIGASFTFTAAQTDQPVTLSASTVLTTKQPVALVLSAPATTLTVGQSTTVTVTSPDPAPFGGLVVTLSGGGSGAGTHPATVTIPEYGTSTTFTFSATAQGTYTLSATAQNRLPGTIAFTIEPQVQISSFTPASGPVGSAVTINGTGFDPVGSNNQVRFNGEPAVIVNASATVLNVIVPLKATTGLITVTNSRGTASSASAFTVQDREAFNIALAPASIQVPTGGNGSTRIKVLSTGLNPYPYGAALSVSGLPAGVTAAFDRPTVSINQDAILTLTTQSGTVAAGTYAITVTGTGIAGLVTVARPQTLTLEVLAAGATTVTGRVLHADDGAPFVGARVRLSTAEALTDQTGTYRFVTPPVTGDQVLLIDGHTNNTAQFEFPSAIPMPVMILAGQDNKALTTYIHRVDATKFTTIVPGQAATVTSPDIANYSLNIPAGATLFGWDGQPITKINVRTVSPDRLPIKPVPEGKSPASVYLYYFFREGGANPTTPIPVTMANDIDAAPGEQVEMWYYDEDPVPNANSNQWRLMGMGTVSADGKSVVSNPGVGIPKFCCGASFIPRPIGSTTGGIGGNGGCPTCAGGPPQPQTGNPVDLATGNALAFRPRPFGMSMLMPVNPNLQYRSTDPRIGLFGRGMSFTYDWFAQALGTDAVRVTNPSGVQFMLSKEADGVFRSRAGRSGSIEMEVTATPSGRTLRLASGAQYDFDGAGRLLAIRDLNGNTTRFTLGTTGFPLSMTDAAGRVYTFTHIGANPNINVSRITDPQGRFVQFDYDTSRRLIRYTDQGGGVTQLEYDAANRISKVTDPRLAVKTIEYDSAGRVVREALPETAEERYAYTTVGNTVTETRHTDPNGNVTTYRFNAFGFMTQMIDALGRSTRYELDPVTNFARRRIDPAGRVTQYFYNARGDLVRTIDPDNNETLTDYDARFRKPTRIQNALGHITTMVYDAQGNLTSMTNAELETTSFSYTTLGQLETITDPLTRVTRFTYDTDGNLLTTTNTAGETVSRTYDAANRLATLTDALGRLSQLGYDALDRVKEVRDAANGLTQYAYDANDNLLSATDPNNNPVERNVYDLRNRLKMKTDAKNLDTAYEYDGGGNLTRMTDRKGQVTTYSYDPLNRLTQVQDADRTTSYSYDLAGNLAKISDTQSGEMLMSYDLLNRLTEVVTAQGTVSYAYDTIGRRTSRTLSGGDVTTYTYDKANRIKTVTLRDRAATYSYDLAGRLTEKVLPNGLKGTYQYDAADRVTSIAYTKPDNTPVESVAYAYDAGGQRITKTEGQVAPLDTGFAATYDEANRLATITLNGELFTLSYDNNGNLATKSGLTSGTTTYTWSAKNQLIALSGPSGNGTFKYDAMGRRIEKTVNGVTTGFLYDGAQAIAEIKGGAFETVYHTGVQIDEVLGRYAASGNRTLLQDALMSVIAQANDAGNAENFYAYSAYGEATTLGPDYGNPLQYTGRENDGAGLYYYRARYYDPVLKQWISEDPIGMTGGLNFRTYVGGNPVSIRDPRGLDNPGMGPYGPGKFEGNTFLQNLAGLGFQENGNFVSTNDPTEPQFRQQDMVCSFPANVLNLNQCTKNCCITHDACYRRNGCNASSWLSNAAGLNNACQKCNEEARKCITENVMKSNCSPETSCP